MQTTANPSHGLRLYDYAASANCYKVRLLLAQLGRPYERIPVESSPVRRWARHMPR